jgi:hypothetical protein
LLLKTQVDSSSRLKKPTEDDEEIIDLQQKQSTKMNIQKNRLQALERLIRNKYLTMNKSETQVN